MKKIININLSGRVIPIEDSAYQQLQQYMESLRRHFANEEGRDEIINDIESRIAELMNEHLRKGASHISDEYVQEVINTMGRPEDFDDSEAEFEKQATGGSSESNTSGNYQQQSRFSSKRFYRDVNDKFIGGVCSGLASYLNVDPAIVRIIFAILAFGGWGSGFLIYILLWIFVPAKNVDSFNGKRLYRNPEDKVIGGVAGGLAAYFNRKTWEMRLIFVAPVILSALFGPFIIPNIFFGSLSGTFLLAYIILWIVLPEASSPYQKMEMRGEQVDINSIKQNVQDGYGNVKQRVKEWSKEVAQTAEELGEKAKTFSQTRGREFGTDFSNTVNRSTNGIGHAFAVLFKAFFFIIFGSIAFGLFVAIMSLLFGGLAWWPMSNFIWTSSTQQWLTWATIILFFLVPIIAFITWIIRRLINAKSANNYLGWIFGGLWTLGWVALMFTIGSFAKDLRQYESVENPVEVSSTVKDHLTVTVSEKELNYNGNFGWITADDWEGWDLSKDSLKLAWVSFETQLSPDDKYHVTLKKYAAGSDEEDATKRAEALKYTATSYDSVLDLSNGITINSQSKFRNQKVVVVIQIPAGKKVRFHESIKQKLNSVSIKSRRTRNGDTFQIDNDNNYWWRSNIYYTMQPNGQLIDDSKPVITESENRKGGEYRYNDGNRTQPTVADTAIIDFDKQIREAKEKKEAIEREKEETERKLKELEKMQKEAAKMGTTFQPVKKAHNTERIIGIPGSVVGVLCWI